MQVVADKLGLDPEALKKALEGGSTMSSLAAQAGISQYDLVATVAAVSAQLAESQNRGALVNGYT